jgi:peptidoglycan/xylan/chitin deacetylase (PgdA/CDA1 family)
VPARAPRAIFPVPADALATQLEQLGRAFEFVSRDDVVAAALGERGLPERACLVTFDDGLRCQLDHALPVLERLEVPAVFFVPALPLVEAHVLTVHKLHHVRERLTDDQLAAELEHTGIDVDDVDDEAAQAHYRYDTPSSARIKYLLNMTLPAAERDLVIDELFLHVQPDEASFCADLYMSSADVGALERSRRAVGAHSYEHRPLALLAPRDRKRDLARCTATLEQLMGQPPRAFSYPHGTSTTVDVESARDVAASGFEIAFTMERALNRSLAEPCLLARLDANDAPGGRQPLVDIDEDRIVVGEGATEGRRLYLDERHAA